MNIFKGISYNLRGLGMGLRTPLLLFLGFVRIIAIIALTIVAASLILVYHQELVGLIWSKPESRWIIWLWYMLSWILSLILVGLAAIISFLASQILFSVVIMDQMSRITEKMVTGYVKEAQKMPWFRQFSYLIKQEIPRTTIPVLLTVFITVVGLLTPVGPILAIVTAGVAVIFLAWDNTDLTPARRLEPFKKRLNYLMRDLPFHLGFGLPFLIPGINILFLSFAPVGATLYYIDQQVAQGG